MTFPNFWRSYYCSFGPEDNRGEQSTKQKISFGKKRGCECQFIVKVMVDNPNITILTYNMYEHEDEGGWPCHGQHDNLGDVRTMHRPKLSRNIVAYVESCFSLGVLVDTIYKFHIKRHVDMDVVV